MVVLEVTRKRRRVGWAGQDSKESTSKTFKNADIFTLGGKHSQSRISTNIDMNQP